MYKRIGKLTAKSIIASVLVLATVFVYVIGDNFSFLAYFKDDKAVQNTIFDTDYDGLRSVSDLTLAETGTEMGKIGEDLSSGFEKLVSDCSNQKTFSNGKNEFIELVSDLKKRSLSELDSTNNSTEEYENYRALVVSGFEEIEGYADQLNEENSEEVLRKIEDTVTYEQPYVKMADDLPFNNITVENIKYSAYNSQSVINYQIDVNGYSDDDLQQTNDTTINDDVRAEFAELESVLEVYQYIKNNYTMEFYFGSRKGAVGASAEKAGNDYDIASVLIGVLRDRNIPARYVRGKIEITAEQAMEWTATDDINVAMRVIAALGIPTTGMISSDGDTVAVRLEHIWVEAYVPYTDYRGTGNCSGESLWVPLDASFKQSIYIDGVDMEELNDYISDESNYLNENSVVNDVSVSNIAQFVDGKESAVVKYMLENGYDSTVQVFGGKEIVYEDLGYLPLSLPYSSVSNAEKFDDIPAEYTDTINFELLGNSTAGSNFNGSDYINEIFYAPDVYGKRLTLTYAPATAADSNLIAEYGGIFSTPAYLVKLKPQFVIDGKVIAEGSACNTGYMQKYNINIYNSESGQNDSEITNTVTVGGMYSLVLDYGNISTVEAQNIKTKVDSFSSVLDDDNAYDENIMGELLNAVGKIYFSDLDTYNQMIAGQRNVTATRALSLGIVGFKANVKYTFNMPSEIKEGGMFLDIGHDVHSVISNNNSLDAEKQFMLQAGVYASAMEHGVLEQITGVESVSTIKVLQYAADNNVPIHYITRENLESEISQISFSEQLINEIRYAVNSGKVIVIPEREIDINQWSGVGYMVLDPDTCACGYMISGGMAGGAMTWYEVIGQVAWNVLKGVVIGLGFMLLGAIFPELIPLLIIAGCIGAFATGWSIGTHLYNAFKYGDVREFQEAMIELSSFCFTIAIFEGAKSKAKSDVTEEPETAERANAESQEACENGKCFIAGTLVATPNGYVPIENINTGMLVYSFNPKTLEISENKVEETFIRATYELVNITANSEIISTTPEHPFYVPQKGFVNAIDLRAGDILLSLNNEYIVVEKIEHEILEKPICVYNFRVSNDHTYFVGSSEIGVHNAKYGKNAMPSKNEFGHTFERHGAQQTNNLIGRAANSGNQGQWLHNENAANFLKTVSPPETGTTVEIEIPDGLGRVITPNGEFIPTNKATVVFKPDGTIRTAYPTL